MLKASRYVVQFSGCKTKYAPLAQLSTQSRRTVCRGQPRKRHLGRDEQLFSCSDQRSEDATGGEILRKHAPLAQLVEQLTLNQWVLGSSPRWCTTDLQRCKSQLARWSSGQDGGLSRRKREFDSPTGHQEFCLTAVGRNDILDLLQRCGRSSAC